MVKFLISLILLLLLSLPLDQASAHLAGQIPFFKINGKLSNLYQVPLSSAPNFTLPQDSPPEDYFINQELSFELLANFLPINYQELDQTQFSWDFGDGSYGSGLTQAHLYQKQGSFILKIFSKGPRDEAPILIQSILINVLPSVEYKLPKSKIEANGESANDPLLDTISADFEREIRFNGVRSESGSAQITSYTWDFGDKTLADKVNLTHQYSADLSNAFPVLRVIDANGFISDSFIELNNSNFKKNSESSTSDLPVRYLADQGFLNSTYFKLNNFLRQNLFKIKANPFQDPLVLITLILFSILAGALHAFTPGHGKSVMAATLIGKNKGKITDALIIALAITFSHTIVIFGLGFVLLGLNQTQNINYYIPIFEKISILLVIFLGIKLITDGLRSYQHLKSHENDHSHTHDHNRNIKNITSKLDLFLAGGSGGIVPCLDALSLLLLSVSLGQIGFGMILVLFFSLGLSLSIILIGIILITSKNKLKIDERMGNLSQIYGPLISGSVLIILAIVLFIK